VVNNLKPLLYKRVYFSISVKMYWESRNYISLAAIQLYERNLNQAAINICNLTVGRIFLSRPDVCKKKMFSRSEVKSRLRRKDIVVRAL